MIVMFSICIATLIDAGVKLHKIVYLVNTYKE